MTVRGLDWLDVHAPAVIAVVLGVATLLAIARLLLRQWRCEPGQRSRAWRLALLVLAQPLCATLLYLTLLPPSLPGTAGTLVVATAGTPAEQWRSAGSELRLALPEARALPGAERVPDLATAIRRYPATRQVRVLGAGLEARDRDAARGITIEFAPPALPVGIVELERPAQSAVGSEFRVSGRVEGVRGGEVELVDPASHRIDRTVLQADGRFVLSGTARVPGAAMFRLRVRDARKRVVESAEVPIEIEALPPPRVLLLAGAPGAEIKYLRRWAQDAGLPVHARIDLGGGLHGGDGAVPFDASGLGRFDLVVLDDRAWASLGESQRAALSAAVRSGLGMLLRITAAPSDVDRRRLRALGFDVGGGRDTLEARIAPAERDDDAARARIGPGTADAPRPRTADVPAIPVLTRRAVRIAATDGVTSLADSAGVPLVVWRAEGRGRIGVSSLVDSHRLVLAGRSDVHGELWSGVAAALARPRDGHASHVERIAPPGERATLCGLQPGSRVRGPDGAVTELRIDPVDAARACAAFFPAAAGWHRLHGGGHDELFHVPEARVLPGVRSRERRDATLQLAAASPIAAARGTDAAPRQPGERWPWWLAWLIASAALWWFERARTGRAL